MKTFAVPGARAAGSLLLLMIPLVPMVARAQAWLPDAGRGSLFVGYEYGNAHWTLYPYDVTGIQKGPYVGGPGNKVFEGEHYDQIVTADLEYGIRRGLATSFRVAWVAARYAGLNPHRDRTGQIEEVDNGDYHGSFQDAEVTLRQTVLRTPFVATPFVGYLFPLTHYEARGHAATGYHLREFRVGASLARNLRPFLPNAYAQVTYTYSAAEHQFDHDIHRNGVNMELGYFLSPRILVRGAANWIRSSGGVDWYLQSQEFRTYTFHHDELANARSWRLAGGASFGLTPRLSLYTVGYATVSGASTHAANGVASGVGWGFIAPWAH